MFRIHSERACAVFRCARALVSKLAGRKPQGDSISVTKKGCFNVDPHSRIVGTQVPLRRPVLECCTFGVGTGSVRALDAGPSTEAADCPRASRRNWRRECSYRATGKAE